MKKRTMKMGAVVLASMLLMSGCGAAGSDTTGSTAAKETVTAGTEQKEVEKIVFATWTINTLPSEDEIQKVEDKINEITVDRDGIEVDLKLYPYSEYFQQVSLALQSGEQVDVFTSYGNFASAVSQDMCYDITDLVDEYAPNARKVISDKWLEATTVNGSVYGIPAWMPVAMGINTVYRTDIAEELGLDMSQVKSVFDLTSVLEKVKEAHPEMYPVCGGAGVNGGISGLTLSIPDVDYLGDDYYSPAGVLLGDDMTVVNLFETQEYKDRVKLAREWHENGLIMQDLATTTLSNVEILAGGNSFANITLQGSDPSVVGMNTGSQTGQEMDSFYMGDSYLDTSAVNTNTWCISSNCKNPEAALRFLNLTYGDADIINLIVYGIEGEDYVVQEDGTIAIPEGFDATSVPYPGYFILTGSWSMGDMYRMAGTTEESVQWSINANKNSKCSPALGFTFDSSSVQTQYTAVNNVIKQYYSALDCGSVDPEVELPKFIQALKDAGIDDIIAEKQAQLDAWAAQD